MNWYETYLHMKAGTALDEAHLRELNAVLEQYPFFALGRMMVAKVATKLNDPRAQQLRFLGALYAPSRQHYAFFLEERMRPRVPPPPRVSPAARETQTPPTRTEKKEEPTSSGEEPGPAAMPYSEAFSPPLQGWIAARQVLYGGLGRRLRAQLAAHLVENRSREPSPPASALEKPIPEEQLSEIAMSAPPSSAPSETAHPAEGSPPASQPIQAPSPSIAEKPSESALQSTPSVESASATPKVAQVSPSTQRSELSPVHSLREAPSQPTNIRHSIVFSPIGIATILQLELPSSSRQRQDTAPDSPAQEAPTAASPSIAPETVASVPAEAPSETPISPESTEPALPPTLQMDDLREQFHRAYVPLEAPEAPLRSFTSAAVPEQPQPSLSTASAESSVEPHTQVHPESKELTTSSLPEAAVSALPESPREPPIEAAPSPILQADDLREQSHRAYVPLEAPEAPLRFFTSPEAVAPESEQPIPSAASSESPIEPQTHFHREYIPLEGAEQRIHLSASEAAPPPATWFVSESPIRSFVPLQIDLEASIHLPIPEPEEVSVPIIQMPEGSAASSQSTETAPSESTAMRGWQSFLEEIQKELPLPSASPSPVAQELEELRREFIRRLLAQRPAHSPPANVSAEENLIDLLLRKIETFHPQPPSAVEREVPDLMIPGWEMPAPTPKVYTETMARLYWSQGDAVRAIQVYEGLIQKHPENAEYYRQQIARIRSGEMP